MTFRAVDFVVFELIAKKHISSLYSKRNLAQESNVVDIYYVTKNLSYKTSV